MKLRTDGRECNHPTCGITCRREKKAKKHYRLQIKPVKHRTAIGAMNLLSVPDLLKIAIGTVHKYVRLRDQKLGCISCSNGKVEEAGHYFDAGVYSGIRLYEKNINGQCRNCNCFQKGNKEGYMIGFIARYGAEALLDLEIKSVATKFYKWSKSELIEIIIEFRNKTKELL
jgi:hypothetical protein